MIGETSSFLRRFDGCLGGGVCCAPYLKLVPISNGCPYYCTYCYLAYVYRDYQPFIKININYDRMFQEIREAASDMLGMVTFNMGEMLDSLALDHVELAGGTTGALFRPVPNRLPDAADQESRVGGLLRVTAKRPDGGLLEPEHAAHDRDV